MEGPLYDVYAVADGRNQTYRRGGYTFRVDQPLRLTEAELTDEIREDPWLLVAPASSNAPLDQVAELEQLQQDHAELKTLHLQALEQLDAANVRVHELEALVAGLPTDPAPEKPAKPEGK